MKSCLLIALLAASVAGCVGLDITPISSSDVTKAHESGSGVKGYIVYAPMVVVEVSTKEVCSDKDDKGGCRSTIVTCSAGTPFILPDMSRPFLVDVRSGFGKTAVEVSITNGWQLGSFQDNSDNTALLDAVIKAIGLPGARTMAREPPTEKCGAPGLYRVVAKDNGVELTKLLFYWAPDKHPAGTGSGGSW